MRVVLVLLLLLVTSIPVGVASFTIATNLSDSRWEYRTEHLQEELDSCHMRDRFEGLRHNASNGKLGP